MRPLGAGVVGVGGVDEVERDVERFLHRVPAAFAHQRVVELGRELLRRLIYTIRGEREREDNHKRPSTAAAAAAWEMRQKK